MLTSALYICIIYEPFCISVTEILENEPNRKNINILKLKSESDIF